MGRLIRWRSIGSYRWEAGDAEFDSLRIVSNGFSRILPAERIFVRKELTGRVRAALDEQLPVWPG
jgi:hypothetical protein